MKKTKNFHLKSVPVFKVNSFTVNAFINSSRIVRRDQTHRAQSNKAKKFFNHPSGPTPNCFELNCSDFFSGSVFCGSSCTATVGAALCSTGLGDLLTS